MTKTHVVAFSGGKGSWYAAKRLVEQRNTTENMLLVFTDTLMEDEDLYRFLIEGAANVIGLEITPKLQKLMNRCLNITPIESSLNNEVLLEHRKNELAEIRREAIELIPNLVWLVDGRTPWEVFYDKRFLGNSRVDPCSKILKRDLSDKYIEDNFSPEECIIYIGIDWSEQHRYDKLAPRKLPYVYKAPLCEEPLIDLDDPLNALKKEGIEIPRLYKLGFSHNNCGGFCIKAGQGHFSNLAKQLPERFQYHAKMEQEIQKLLEKDITVLKRTIDGVRYRFPLLQLGKEVSVGNMCDIDETDIGGCGCFLTDEDEKVYEDQVETKGILSFISEKASVYFSDKSWEDICEYGGMSANMYKSSKNKTAFIRKLQTNIEDKCDTPLTGLYGFLKRTAE